MNKMSSNPSTYFINVLCENEKQYRIHTVWNDNSFVLTVIDDFKAFISNVSNDTLKELANKYEAVLDTYIEEIRSSLIDDKDVNNIIYNRVGNTLIISRKKAGFSVQVADFILEEIDFNNSALNIIDKMNESSQFYQSELLATEKEMKTVVEEKNLCVLKLEEFVTKKKDMEHELYSKFILILNEKKRRIQYLQESLEKVRKGKGQLNIELEEKCEVNGSKQEVISDTDTETSIDEPAETIIHNVQIETPRKNTNFFDDDEDDSLPIKSLPKRAKITKGLSPPDKINIIINDTVTTDDNVASTSKEMTKSPEIITETNKEETQNSLDFNTEDLFDRF